MTFRLPRSFAHTCRHVGSSRIGSQLPRPTTSPRWTRSPAMVGLVSMFFTVDPLTFAARRSGLPASSVTTWPLASRTFTMWAP